MYICEKCGKEHDGTYGSGRFCCQSCANTHKHTKQTKEKIQKAIYSYMENLDAKFKRNPLRHEGIKRTCVICGKEFMAHSESSKTCSRECGGKLGAITKIKNHSNLGGGYRENSVRGKSGYYKGIHCHSTYELYWVIYNLDHNISFKRCNKVFDYEYNGKWYKYYPDFELDDDTIIEIKGVHIPTVDIKAQAVIDSGYKYKILYDKDLKHCFDYVNEKYSVTNHSVESLYEQYEGIYTKICPICGKEFKTIHKHTKCCSMSCGAKLAHMTRKKV